MGVCAVERRRIGGTGAEGKELMSEVAQEERLISGFQG
jgi:hypothetical protein